MSRTGNNSLRAGFMNLLGLLLPPTMVITQRTSLVVLNRAKVHGQSKETIAPMTVKLRVKG
jgi:hypothetical protein